MTLRMAALATFIAVLPLSVDAPRDSSHRRGQTRFEAAAGSGQYGIVTRGCNNEVLDVVDIELRGGALAIEHETPAGIVIGVRGGEVREKQGPRTVRDPYGGGSTSYPGGSLTNRYVNPHVALEAENAGIGLGLLHADHPFAAGGEERTRYDVSGHLRLGNRDSTTFAIRFMEDVPLQQMGNLTFDLAIRPKPWIELGPSLGLAGPFDGTVLGVRGRFWLTPEAALHVRACFGGVEQFGLAGGVAARWPGRR
jgi:hypothetical protein